MTFTNSTVSASYSVKAKKGIDRRYLLKDRVDWAVIRKNRSCNIYQCRFTLFAGFKRETTQTNITS